jgi:hypothetical protein
MQFTGIFLIYYSILIMIFKETCLKGGMGGVAVTLTAVAQWVVGSGT